MSLGATTHNWAKTQTASNDFLSLPDNIHSSHSSKSNGISSKLRLSSSQISALSVGDVSGLDFVSEKLVSRCDDNERSKTNNIPKTIGWRLIYNPRCVLLGIALLTFSSGIHISLECVPPFGKQIGNVLLPFTV